MSAEREKEIAQALLEARDEIDRVTRAHRIHVSD
jgi:hypothetical protein